MSTACFCKIHFQHQELESEKGKNQFVLGKGPKKCKSVVFDHLGGGVSSPLTPLIVKYINKGNVHHLVEKQRLKKITIRRPH